VDVFVHALNGFLMIAMPLALGIFLARRLRVTWRLFLVGGLTFLGSQVLHIPFNNYVLAAALDRLGVTQAQQGMPLAILALLAGLSAGVFEEGARYLVYRFWLKEERSWSQALMFGAGHGGVEAILLGMLATYGFVQVMALRGVDLATVFPSEQVELARSQVAAYWAMPWYDALMGAFERVGALCLQVSMAVMVLQAFTRRNVLWLLAAILWHALVDAVAVFALPTWGAYIMEGLVAVLALGSVALVFGLRTPEPEPVPVVQAPLPAPRTGAGMAAAPEATPDKLDDSRFTG
jgi:uncharacterized membrane protein YhfC